MLLMTFWYTVLVTWPCKPSERYRVRGSPKGTRDLQKKKPTYGGLSYKWVIIPLTIDIC